MTFVNARGEIVEVVGVAELVKMGAKFLEDWPNKEKVVGGRKISGSQKPVFEIFVQDLQNPKKHHGFRGFGQLNLANRVLSEKVFID